jgi:urea transport system ATP-binding protein
MLTITDLNQSYGGSHTLWDVTLTVPPGSRTCLMGRQRMGKSTLLKCVMGLLPATSGSIAVRQSGSARHAGGSRARVGIGYVPQGREIFPHLTVEENLRVGLGARARGDRQVPARVYELFPVLKKMLWRRGGDLSGGQAAAAGDRPGARAQSGAADPRRADRGDPAEHRARDRRRHPRAQS